MDSPEPDPTRVLREQEARLLEEFHGRLAAEAVTRQFRAAVDGFAEARVRTYVPLLAYRTARNRLVEMELATPTLAAG